MHRYALPAIVDIPIYHHRQAKVSVEANSSSLVLTTNMRLAGSSRHATEPTIKVAPKYACHVLRSWNSILTGNAIWQIGINMCVTSARSRASRQHSSVNRNSSGTTRTYTRSLGLANMSMPTRPAFKLLHAVTATKITCATNTANTFRPGHHAPQRNEDGHAGSVHIHHDTRKMSSHTRVIFSSSSVSSTGTTLFYHSLHIHIYRQLQASFHS